jgi:hypothetical protein
MLISKFNINKNVKLFTAIFVIVIISACTEQSIVEVQSQPSSSLKPIETVRVDPKPTDSKVWEEVSRIQRVLGIITEIQISDGIVESIDLKVNQNVQPINNPVDYNYVDQTIHLIVDEALTAAGSFQDKLRLGSAFLVSFAQFSIPPKGEIALASRFSYNYFFYEHNGSYMDTKGQPFDLEAEIRGATNPTTEPIPKTDKKILYSLDKNQLSKSLTQIPYYQQGKSEPLPEVVLKQFSEGHQPWLSDALTVALVNCSNLISSEKVDVLSNKSTGNEKKTIIDSERIITLISSEDTDLKVLMTKPGGISYEITMFAPKGTGVLYVKQIIEITPSS